MRELAKAKAKTRREKTNARPLLTSAEPAFMKRQEMSVVPDVLSVLQH